MNPFSHHAFSSTSSPCGHHISGERKIYKRKTEEEKGLEQKEAIHIFFVVIHNFSQFLVILYLMVVVGRLTQYQEEYKKALLLLYKRLISVNNSTYQIPETAGLK